MTRRHPPDGIGLYIRTKYRYPRPIVLTERQLIARRANAAKARVVAGQANLQARLGLRPQWRVKAVPTKHRCVATSQRTKQRCRQWALKKPGGGYFRVCWWHGGALALAGGYGYRPESKVIYGRVMTQRQWQRYERKWREQAEVFDASPPPRLKPLYPT
jgi:hypothetical protein